MLGSRPRITIPGEALILAAVGAFATIGAIGTVKALKKKMPQLKKEMCRMKDDCVRACENVCESICDDMCPDNACMTGTEDDTYPTDTEEPPINPT